MPYDPIRVADTRSWLEKAASDLRAGAHELTAMPPFTGDAAFHAQQAAEKTLKGFLIWNDVPFRRTHDLGELGHQCAEIDPTLTVVLRSAASLTQYAWKYRYPGEPAEPSLEEAQRALDTASEIHRLVLARLPQSVHPISHP
jgi:HEPN domain-containing protein